MVQQLHIILEEHNIMTRGRTLANNPRVHDDN